MTLPARCHSPRTARLAGFDHMNDYDLETQSWIGTDQVLGGEPRACRLSHEPHRSILDCHGLSRPVTHIEAMYGWSMSLTGFGAAKLRAAVRAMLKRYDGAEIQVATRCRITSLPGTPQKTNCVSPRYWADSRYIQDITARPGLLSVTESVALPPQPKRRSHVRYPQIRSS